MRPKRIAICSVQVPFVRGGAEKLASSLHTELSRRGILVETIQIPFKWYPVTRLATEAMIWRMVDVTEADGKTIDCVIATKFPATAVRHPDKRLWLCHQHRPIYDLYGTHLGDEFGSEVDQTGEHDAIRKMIIDLDNVTLRESTRVFTISKNVSGRLKRFNDIDSTHLYPPPEHKEQFHAGSYGDEVLYVGRLDRKKRLSLLVDAFAHVRSAARCVIAGTGGEAASLADRIRRLGLDDKVRLLGWVPDQDVHALFANAMAVYYAPFDEDYGYATVEAFLSRRPVITARDAGGVLEFVSDGDTGSVVDPDPESIAGSIDALFENRRLCHALGSNGYDLVKDITWDRVIERLVD
jgi:glycosyltransferase involved in cell wall biosynthesis